MVSKWIFFFFSFSFLLFFRLGFLFCFVLFLFCFWLGFLFCFVLFCLVIVWFWLYFGYIFTPWLEYVYFQSWSTNIYHTRISGHIMPFFSSSYKGLLGGRWGPVAHYLLNVPNYLCSKYQLSTSKLKV